MHLVIILIRFLASDGQCADETSSQEVRRPDCTLATVDHNIPTSSRRKFKNINSFIEEEMSRQQVLALERNVETFQLPYFGMQDSPFFADCDFIDGSTSFSYLCRACATDRRFFESLICSCF